MISCLRAAMWIMYVIIPTLTFAQEVEPSSGGAGRWGPWTSWSVCSQTCGSGLAYRIRLCHRSSSGGSECSGRHKQYQVCKREECPGAQDDYRTVECRKHNRNYYGGRRYQWEAFINPYARCELACKARHHRYYARFQKTVQDGTKCKPDSDAICLAGECLDVGCDGVLGSGAIVDHCGICGGDGSTCRVISGIFTRTRLTQYGYHHVTTIPSGACNINITELARSRNYLALTTAAGSNIVNADKQLRPIGQYAGAGTTFDYRRRSGLWCPGACIFADGPITEPVKVQLLYYDRNPGIMYHFTVPQDTATAVMNAANSSHSPQQPHHHHQRQQPDPHHHQRQQPDPHHHQRLQHKPPHHQRQQHNPPHHQQSHAHRNSGRSSEPKHSNKHTHGSRHNRQDQDDRLASLSAANPNVEDTTTASLRDAPSYPREELSPRHLRRRPSTVRTHGSRPSPPSAESPFQPRSSVIPRQASVASAPRYVPPEQEGAPIEYKHYYHVDSDDYRRHSQRAAFNSRLSRNELARAGAAGAEALSRPNIIPATRNARWRWRPTNDVNNNLNSVGDIPLAVPASGHFVWTISGFSACSEPCGGGTQQTVVVCMKSDTRVVVMAENCDLNARPSSTTVQCNPQPCEAKWTEEEWSECSVTCGHGVQTRTVECKQRISPTLHLSVSADRCKDQKPPVTQFCRRPACFQWKLSNWTKCSTNCGLGERTRTVSCINADGEDVADSRCSEDRPTTREICDMGSCAKGWYYTRWSRTCTPKCGGKAHKTRKVYCAAEDGGTLPGDKCQADKKPRTRKSCGIAQPCGGKWFSGPWSECNATCGVAWRTRDVVCMKKHGRRLWSVVDKENCLRKERPTAREECAESPPCLPEWYMTHWSECSKSCGTGSKTREVKCLDATLQPSLSCNSKRRPHERRPCNKHSCDDNTTANRHRHTNKQQTKPRRIPRPQRFQESTSPNTTFQRFHKHKNRQPLAVQISSPTEVSLQQDVRRAMGDDDEGNSRQRNSQRVHASRHHHHRHHSQQRNSSSHSPESTTKAAMQTTLQTTRQQEQTDDDPNCTDKPSARWCMFVSQARLCPYGHYKEQCCQTCHKYNRHH